MAKTDPTLLKYEALVDYLHSYRVEIGYKLNETLETGDQDYFEGVAGTLDHLIAKFEL